MAQGDSSPSIPREKKQGLVRSGLIVSFMTLVSRVLGLVRDVVVAKLMGDSVAADVFIFANKIPNFLRRLFAEGAFAQAFIPVLTEVHEQVLAALFGTGWFIDYLNDEPDGAKFELASILLKITFPYLAFVALTALSGAILNALNQFAVAAFTPVLLNVAIIGCAIWLSPNVSEPAFALAWGVFIGGAVQLMFQLPFLFQQGLLVKPQWGWSHPQVQKVKTLMIPALFGVSVSQINLLLDTFIASFLVTGSISWLYYSDRLLEFPLGLFGIAIATVILPALSRNHIGKDAEKFHANLDWAIRTVCCVGLPSAAGLAVLAEPILKVIFERGAFSAYTASMASISLTAYAIGLTGFMLVKVLAPGFYSRQDTKTPVRFGIICMVANMGLNLILVFPLQYVGLALATSLSGLLNAGLLYAALKASGVYTLSKNTKVFILRCLLATAAMIYGLNVLLEYQNYMQADFVHRLFQLAIAICAGGVVYLLVCICSGIRIHQLKPTS
jgi:putative peptidoglycan lipid II flippase